MASSGPVNRLRLLPASNPSCYLFARRSSVSQKANTLSSSTCPLCAFESFAPAWLGTTLYRGKEFPYVACGRCGSLYCRPMPDAEDLASMYGTSYESCSGPDSAADPKEPEWVLDWLERTPPGSFVDYGCGGGDLLVGATTRGWRALGVELAPDVVNETSRRTGLPVLTVEGALGKGAFADVLHLGDVLEHLTDLDREMPRILSLIKPGGLLLAQGPLEANGNLFTWMLRLARSLRGRPSIEMPPYHVILATMEGQWALFRRFGLTAVEQELTEVFWPAPARLSWKDLLKPRGVGLYSVRLVSRALSRLRSRRWGNRYRYAGRLESG